MKHQDVVKKAYKLRTSLALNIIGVIILVLLIFGIIVSAVGFVSFTNAIKEEYETTTYHMDATAATLINGDHVADYLAGKRVEEYEETNKMLDDYCHTIHVSLIYLIVVDQSDYGRFVSVFNVVDNAVDDSAYTAWELGYQRDTTNDKYRQKYRAIYEKKAEYETYFRIHVTDGQHDHVTTMVPVENSKGEVIAILCMQRPMSELKKATRPYLITIIATTVLLAILSAIFVTHYLRKQLVKPVKTVSEEAQRFAKENTLGEPLGPISRFKEISNLAMSIDTMEADMVKNIEQLTEATAERERLGVELNLARSIQENGIPNKFPPFPERTEFDLYASMTPAREVGGDFYNFQLIDEDHLAVIIGDVSGKGVPAALFMMVINILTGNRVKMGGTPGEILSFVNNSVCQHNKAEMFVTLWLGILEISTGKLTFTNAGHDDAAICRKDGIFELLETRHGMVLGAFEDVVYEDEVAQLQPGDKIFLYTDGIPEAMNTENKMYSIDRMLATLTANRDKAPGKILENLKKNVEEFVGEAPQFDDLTMLCLEIKDKSNE